MRLVELLSRKNSGEIARKRLKFLLVSDRAGCSPELLEMIKNDLLRSFSRYMDFDPGELNVCIVRTASGDYKGKLPALYAGIPIQDLQNKGSFTA